MGICFEILGARGGLSVSGQKFQQFGSATSCYRMITDEGALYFDAGTGIVPIGQTLVQQQDGDFRVDIMFSHAHFDHLQGLPFFAPLYDSRFDINLWACDTLIGEPFEAVFGQFLESPLCPVRRNHFKAKVSFHNIELGTSIKPRPGFDVHAMGLSHPGGDVALKASSAGVTVAYSGDFEHGNSALDRAFSDWLLDVDLAALDCTYTPETYLQSQGFGHSHWQAIGRIAQGCKRWVGVHHHHLSDDVALSEIEQEILHQFPNGGLGREGATFKLG